MKASTKIFYLSSRDTDGSELLFHSYCLPILNKDETRVILSSGSFTEKQIFLCMKKFLLFYMCCISILQTSLTLRVT